MCRLTIVAIVALVAVGAGCTAPGNGDAGPTGKPETVVAEAPDRTLAARTARVEAAAPGTYGGPRVTAAGSVTFATGADTLVLRPRPDRATPFGVAEPAAALDLLRGVVGVTPYGGAEVQGIGTKRYEVEIDLFKAITSTPPERRTDLHLLDGRLGSDKRIWGDVFVDSQGRVRRILLPVATDSDRPHGDSKRIPPLVSIDFSDFGATA